MSVIFVKQLPTSFEREYLYCEADFGYRYALVLKDTVTFDLYDIYIEDFILNCENDYIQRRFKKTICSQWHGRWASEAPLFLKYVSLVKEKHDTYLRWATKVLKNWSENPMLEKGRKLLDSEDRMATAFYARPPPSTGTGVVSGDFNFPEDLTGYTSQEARDFLEIINDYLGTQLDSLTDTQFSDLQDAISKFHRLPRVGETVMVRQLGAYIIQDITWNAQQELCFVALSSTTGKMIPIPFRELSLSRSGTWLRENQCWTESAQDVVRSFRGIVQFGGQAVTIWKWKEIMRGVNAYLPALYVGRGRTNAAIYAFLYLLPNQGFDFLWDNVFINSIVGYDNFDEVTAIDSSLPLGQRQYIHATTGEYTDPKDTKGFFESSVDSMFEWYESGKNLGSNIITTTTETVTSLFYGAAILGSMAIVYKFVS
jgi:hypothetical protein